MQGVSFFESVSTCTRCQRTPQCIRMRSWRTPLQATIQRRPAPARPPHWQRFNLACRASGEDDPFQNSGGGGSGGRPEAPFEARKQAQPRLSDPSQTVAWGGTLPRRRRAVLGALSGIVIALGGNLGGVSSWLLALDGGKLAGRTRLDVIIPVAGLSRCADYENGYEFQYPQSWLADQSIYRRAMEQGERRRSLDPLAISDQRRRQRTVAEPTSAFGPPDSSGEENISVIAAPITAGFRLEGLGSPSEAGQRFLSTTVAPEGSGRTAVLLAASSRVDDSGTMYYTLEYTLQTTQLFRHNLSVYAAREEVLYTFNAQCPEKQWAVDASALSVSANSFKLMPPKKQLPTRF